MKALAIAATGMNAQQTNLEVIANNIANARTVGYRANGVNFNPLVSNTQDFDTVFTKGGRAIHAESIASRPKG